jgi:hypothetical protein
MSSVRIGGRSAVVESELAGRAADEEGSGHICPDCLVVVARDAVLVDARETDVLVPREQGGTTP